MKKLFGRREKSIATRKKSDDLENEKLFYLFSLINKLTLHF